jgi:hypothetical protein
MAFPVQDVGIGTTSFAPSRGIPDRSGSRAQLDTTPEEGSVRVITRRSGVHGFEPLLIGIGVGIGIGIEPERSSIPIPIPIPTAKGWVEGVSPHRFWG